MVAEGGEGENPLPKRPQAPGGPGPKPWGPGPQAPWRPGPQAPGAWIPPLSPVDFLQAFLTSCCVLKSWVRVSKRYHNSATLAGVGWFPKAELHSSMRGRVPVFAPAFQLLGRLSPASRQEFKKCPGAHRLMKSLACCTDSFPAHSPCSLV